MYSEHDKIKALGNQNQVVGSFLEWLQEHGFTICEYAESEYTFDEGYFAHRNTIQDWLAQYFNIDLRALEAEKLAMLEEMRKAG